MIYLYLALFSSMSLKDGRLILLVVEKKEYRQSVARLTIGSAKHTLGVCFLL